MRPALLLSGPVHSPTAGRRLGDGVASFLNPHYHLADEKKETGQGQLSPAHSLGASSPPPPLGPAHRQPPLPPGLALLCCPGEVQGPLPSAAAGSMAFFKGSVHRWHACPTTHSHDSFHGHSLFIVSIIVICGVALCSAEGHTRCCGSFCVVPLQASVRG